MKKLILGAILLFSTLSFGQKYKIVKTLSSVNSSSFGVKMDGFIIIKNDTLHIETKYKDLTSNSDLKIINTLISKSDDIKRLQVNETYQAVGNWNLGDKHQISVFSNNVIHWKKINSFDNSSVDLYFKIEQF